MKVAERFGAEWRDPYLTRPFDGARERDRYIDITDPDFWRICAKCVPYTLVSVPRLYDLYRSVRYVCDAAVPGDLVECGVLLGGAVMLMAETLTLCGDRDRRIYLYDTFCGSPRHTAADVDFTGRPFEEWSTADFLPDTRANLALADFPADRYEIIVGPVQDTISRWAPDMACLVRLDTDTYSSTLAELQQLYPRLAVGGVLSVDDYGFCVGCRKAVDRYFRHFQAPILLHRIDYTGRSGIKC